MRTNACERHKISVILVAKARPSFVDVLEQIFEKNQKEKEIVVVFVK
jgi:hypothetical protein